VPDGPAADLPAPEGDLVEPAPGFEGGFEVGPDDVGEQLEYLEDIRLTDSVRTDKDRQRT
jgi:hypothetical protein